jgi:Fe-S cluster assembly ATPase SufC
MVVNPKTLALYHINDIYKLYSRKRARKGIVLAFAVPGFLWRVSSEMIFGLIGFYRTVANFDDILGNATRVIDLEIMRERAAARLDKGFEGYADIIEIIDAKIIELKLAGE